MIKQNLVRKIIFFFKTIFNFTISSNKKNKIEFVYKILKKITKYSNINFEISKYYLKQLTFYKLIYF